MDSNEFNLSRDPQLDRGYIARTPNSAYNRNFQIIEEVVCSHADLLNGLRKEMQYVATVAMIALGMTLLILIALIISW